MRSATIAAKKVGLRMMQSAHVVADRQGINRADFVKMLFWAMGGVPKKPRGWKPRLSKRKKPTC